MSPETLETLKLVASAVGIFAFFLPIMHAARSGDTVPILGSISLMILSAFVVFNEGYLGGQLLGVVLWSAAYIVGAMADFTIGAERRRIAENNRQNANRPG